MTLQEELNEMFEVLEGSVARDETPATDPPAEEPPIEDKGPPNTEQPEEPKEEEKAEETPPATEQPKVDDEVVKLRNEIAELKSKVDKPKEEPKAKPPVTDPPIIDEDFVKDLDLDELSRDPKMLNKVLNDIRRNAILSAREEIKRASEVIPTRVKSELEAQKALVELTNNFYSRNEDLKKFPKVVGNVFEEIIAENPGKNYTEILEMVGEETRNRLGLEKPKERVEAKSEPKDKDTPPPLPKKARGRVETKSKPDPSAITSQIDEMNRVLNR